MIRDSMIWISEILFYLTNGVPMANTLWFFVWVALGTILMVIPCYFAISVGRNKVNSLPALVFLFSFFPLLFLIIGPPLLQLQMVSECETVTVDVATDRVENHTIRLRHCRFKDNYYGEFGEWQLSQQTR